MRRRHSWQEITVRITSHPRQTTGGEGGTGREREAREAWRGTRRHREGQRGRGTESECSASQDQPVSYIDDWTDTDTESSVSASNTLLPVLSILTPVSTTEIERSYHYM